MKLRKIAVYALSTLLLAGCAVTAFPAAVGEKTASAVTTTSSVSIDKTNASLALPYSYEQYLPLVSPTDIAVSQNYLAVADGNLIYVCDRLQEEYRVYKHGTTGVSVSKVQFSSDGKLYFADSTLSLHSINPAENILTSTPSPYSLSTFAISGDKLFVASNSDAGSEMRLLKLDGSSNLLETPAFLTLSSKPAMTVENGALFCAVDGTVERFDLDGNNLGRFFLSAETPRGLKSIAVSGETLYYTDSTGLYASNMNNHARLIEQREGYSALTVYENTLFAVNGSTVRAFDIAEERFTHYEISSASASPQRLNGAGDTVRTGNLLVSADKGNHRVSVYDYQEDIFYTIPCEDNGGGALSPEYVAASYDGKQVAFSSGVNIFVYEKGENGYVLSHYNHTTMPVVGITFVFDSCWYVTNNNGYGKTDKETQTLSPKYFSVGMPTALASDLYGTLYVAFTGETVIAFQESDLEQGDASRGETLSFTLPAGFTSLRADFDGNLYCLVGNTVYQNGEIFAQTMGDFVWKKEGELSLLPTSFALGFEDDEVYFQYGNYVVKTNAGVLNVPALNKISVENTRDTAFSMHQPQGLLVDVPAGTVRIFVSAEDFQAEENLTFGYQTYTRLNEDVRGVLLAQTSRFSLVALENEEGNYTLSLFETNDTVAVPLEEYWTETNGTRYLTNRVSSYYAPLLHGVFRDETLLRGESVTLVGKLQTSAGEFALISFAGANGTVTGYLPLSYLTEIPPLREETEEFFTAVLRGSDTGVLFTANDGATLTLTQRTNAQFVANDDGTFTARVFDGGKEYTATVNGDMIDYGETNAVRISLVIVLTVLVIVIIGVYAFLLPKRKHD